MDADTSLNNPLQIDALTAGTGIIGMTLCPGRKGRSPFIGVWDRDLEADLDAIHGWGADMVVSLVEREEFEYYGVPDLVVGFLQKTLKIVREYPPQTRPNPL